MSNWAARSTGLKRCAPAGSPRTALQRARRLCRRAVVGLPLLVDLKANLPWIFTAIVVNRRYVETQPRGAAELSCAPMAKLSISRSPMRPRAKRVLAAEFAAVLSRRSCRSPMTTSRRACRAMHAPCARRHRDACCANFPALGLPLKSANAADYVDASLIEDLRREGFFTAMQAKCRTQIDSALKSPASASFFSPR